MTTPESPTTKQCTGCGTDKAVSHFLALSDTPGEYGSICADCRKAGADNIEKAQLDTENPVQPEDAKQIKEAIESLAAVANDSNREAIQKIINNYVEILRFLYEHHPRREANLKIKADASNTAIIADALCAGMRITTELLLPQEHKREEKAANDTSDLLAELEQFAKSKQRELVGWVEARRGDMIPLHEDITKLKNLITEKKDLINSIRDERAEVFRTAKDKTELDAGIDKIYKKLNIANDDIQSTFYGKRSVLIHIRQRNVTNRRLASEAAGQHNIRTAAKLDKLEASRGHESQDRIEPE